VGEIPLSLQNQIDAEEQAIDKVNQELIALHKDVT
jgi:hypothetical protein